MTSARKNAPLAVVISIVALLGLLVGCSNGSLAATVTGTTTGPAGAQGSTGDEWSSSAGPATTVVPPVASVIAMPALGATGLSPVDPISVKVDKGTIDELTFTNPDGKQVVGAISADRTAWSVA